MTDNPIDLDPADAAGDMARGASFLDHTFNGNASGVDTVVNEAQATGRVRELLYSVSEYLRDGFGDDFRGSDAVAALTEAALRYREMERNLREEGSP